MDTNKQQSLFSFEKKEQNKAFIPHNLAPTPPQRTFFKGTILEGLNKSDLEDKAILNIRTLLSVHAKKMSSSSSRKIFINSLKAEIFLKKGKNPSSLIQRTLILENH